MTTPVDDGPPGGELQGVGGPPAGVLARVGLDPSVRPGQRPPVRPGRRAPTPAGSPQRWPRLGDRAVHGPGGIPLA